jgi:predicted RNA-binding Zn-ribbon protein involved in translation (DUF1610 family)/FtsZ-binding cell division protein ZapB
MTSTQFPNPPPSQPPESDSGSENAYGITDHDLVFDCPHCGRNFVIDQRAAGRAFPCPECEREIEIPPLEELLESGNGGPSAEEAANNADGHVLQLQHELDQAHEEISTLKTEIEELRFRRRYLEKEKAEHARLVEDLNEQVAIMRASLDQMAESLRATEKTARDTQQIG